MNIDQFMQNGPDAGAEHICEICERAIKNHETAAMIELDIFGEILDPTAPDYDPNNPDSLGGFHVGPSCKRKLIKAGADPKWFTK